MNLRGKPRQAEPSRSSQPPRRAEPSRPSQRPRRAEPSRSPATSAASRSSMASPKLRGKPNLREPPREARHQGLASSVASHGEAPKLPELMTQTSRSQLLPSTGIKASWRRRPPRTAANADLRGARTPPASFVSMMSIDPSATSATNTSTVL